MDSLITACMCVCLRVHEHTCVESFEADIHPTTITAVLAPQMKADMWSRVRPLVSIQSSEKERRANIVALVIQSHVSVSPFE